MSRAKVTAVIVAAFGSGALLTAGAGHTFASLSDYKEIKGNTATAGTWGPSTPPTPAQCAGMTFDKVILLTDGNESWDAEAEGYKTQSLLVFGLGGNDVITGGVKDDCLVGGAGDDTLQGGEGKDILIGDAGKDTLTSDNAKDKLYGGGDDDTLYGGNAPDVLDGGSGTNTCYGGNAPDLVNCTPGTTP